MSNITNWQAPGNAMSTVVRTSASAYDVLYQAMATRAATALRGTRGGVDLHAGFTAEPKFDAGPRTWSPPI